MSDRMFGHVHASQHSRHFTDSALIVQRLDFREGGILLGELADKQVLMTLGGEAVNPETLNRPSCYVGGPCF